MDKSSITKICVDDFALRKRYTYGTVMVDFEKHQIIDILESRDTEQVEAWLGTYPNIQVVSRDGSQTYASAITNAHPEALQVSDRFHLLKGLSKEIAKQIRKLIPSQLVIPATQASKAVSKVDGPALYDPRNKAQRIRFAQEKYAEGCRVNDIVLMMRSTRRTVKKYLSIPEGKIPEPKRTVSEQSHQEETLRKAASIEEVRKLYELGNSIKGIMRITGRDFYTIKRYLNKDCPLSSDQYNARLPGKLAPYEKEVWELRSQGKTYPQIHSLIRQKGYTGSEGSLGMFMQKERRRRKELAELEGIEGEVEYIPKGVLCQLAFRELEEVKGLTRAQYEAAVKRHPIIGDLYHLIQEFRKLMFSQRSDKLDKWMTKAVKLEIEGLNKYVNGLKSDLQAVKNGIDHPYNNGLAEGMVNKIKLIKRIMYGRNTFELLRAKVLLYDFYYQIN